MSTIIATPPLTPAELVRRHQADVWRYLRYLGCDEATADDLTQETFLAVIRKPFEQKSEGETAAYLRKVARNQMLMALRKKRSAPCEETLEAAEAVWAELVGGGSGGDLLDSLGDCLEKLEGRAAAAIDLRYRQQQSREEMAAALAMSAEGIKTLLRRTREVLRKCIEQTAQNSR